jgi:phosphatidylinositol alpha-1,6-mannosyltransferase
LRALVLTPDFPPARGGIQTLLGRVTAEWETVRPTVVTLAHPDAAPHDHAVDYEIHRVRSPGPLRHPARIALLNAAAVRLGLRTRPAVVLSGHITCGPAAAALHRLRRTPYVQYLHVNEIGGRPGLTRFAGHHAASVIAVSRYTADRAEQVGVSRERITIIPPGTDLFAPELRTPFARPTIVTVSRLKDAYKGHDVLLAALPAIRAAVPEVRWVVVGDGPLRPALEARARDEGLADCVEFLGSVSDATRDRQLDGAWVFAMPSRIPDGDLMGEGFGIVFLEASARGVPVVAGNVGGTLDAVLHERTGLLVDPADPAAVAAALIRILSDDALAARLSEGGRAFAAGLSWPSIARRVEDELVRAA